MCLEMDHLRWFVSLLPPRDPKVQALTVSDTNGKVNSARSRKFNKVDIYSNWLSVYFVIAASHECPEEKYYYLPEEASTNRAKQQLMLVKTWQLTARTHKVVNKHRSYKNQNLQVGEEGSKDEEPLIFQLMIISTTLMMKVVNGTYFQIRKLQQEVSCNNIRYSQKETHRDAPNSSIKGFSRMGQRNEIALRNNIDCYLRVTLQSGWKSHIQTDYRFKF